MQSAAVSSTSHHSKGIAKFFRRRWKAPALQGPGLRGEARKINGKVDKKAVNLSENHDVSRLKILSKIPSRSPVGSRMKLLN